MNWFVRRLPLFCLARHAHARSEIASRLPVQGQGLQLALEARPPLHRGGLRQQRGDVVALSLNSRRLRGRQGGGKEKENLGVVMWRVFLL